MTYPDAFNFSPSHWGQFVALLSMDSTADFWPQNGVTFSRDHDTVLADLRAMIVSLREAYARQPDPMPDIRSWIFEHNALRWSGDDLERLCRLGVDFVADHADSPQLSAWQIALQQFPAKFPGTIGLIEAQKLVTGLEERLAPPEETVTVPAQLSPWDLQLCARHGWNPESDEGFPPVDTLDIVASLWRARNALLFAAERLSPPAQAMLMQEAQAILTEYGVWMPGPLEPLWLKVSHA